MKKLYSKKTKTLMIYETDSEETVRHSFSGDIHIESECQKHSHINLLNNFSASSEEPRCNHWHLQNEETDTCQRLPACCLSQNTNIQETLNSHKLNPTPMKRLKTSSEIENSCCCSHREEYEWSCQPFIEIKITDLFLACWKFIFNIFIGIFVLLKCFITTDWLNYGTVKQDSQFEQNELSDLCKYHPKTINNRLPELNNSLKLEKISQKTSDRSTQNQKIKLDSECLKLLSRLGKKEVVHQSCQTQFHNLEEFDETCVPRFRSEISEKTVKNRSSQTTNQVRCERRRVPSKVLHSESSETSSSEIQPKRKILIINTNQSFPQSFLEYKDQCTQTKKLVKNFENFGESVSCNTSKPKKCSCNSPHKGFISLKRSDHAGPPNDYNGSLFYSNNQEKQYHTKAEYDFTNRKSVTIQAFESEESGNEKSVKFIRETRTSLHSSEESHKVPNLFQEHSQNTFKLKKSSCNSTNKSCISERLHHNLKEHSNSCNYYNGSLMYDNETKKRQKQTECDFTNQKKSVIIQTFESEESGNEASVKYIKETRTSMHSSEESHKVPNLFQEHSQNTFKLKKCSCNSINKYCVTSERLHHNMEEHSNSCDDCNGSLLYDNETEKRQKQTQCDFTDRKKSVIIQTFESEESGNEASVNYIRETKKSMHSSEESHKVSNLLQEPEPPDNKTLTCNERKLEHSIQMPYVLENLQHTLYQLSNAMHTFIQSNQVPPPPTVTCTEVKQDFSNNAKNDHSYNDCSLGSLKPNEHFGFSNKTEAAGVNRNEQRNSHQNISNTNMFAINTAETTTCLPPILNDKVNLNDCTENQSGNIRNDQFINKYPEPCSQLLLVQHDNLFKDADMMRDNLQNRTEKSTLEPKRTEALDILLKMMEDDPNKNITKIMRRPEQNVKVLGFSNIILPYEKGGNAIQKPAVPSLVVDTIESNQIKVTDQQEKANPKALNDPEIFIEKNSEIDKDVSDHSILIKQEQKTEATDQSALDVIINMMKNDPDKDIRKLIKPPAPEELALSESSNFITPYKKTKSVIEDHGSDLDMNVTDVCPLAEIGEFQNLNPIHKIETDRNVDNSIQCNQYLSRTSSLHSIPNLIRPVGFDNGSTDNKNDESEEDPNSKKYIPTLSVIIEVDEEDESFENNSLQRKKVLCARCNVSEENIKTVLQSEENKLEQTISNEKNINSTENYMKKYFLRMMGEDELDTVNKYDSSERNYRAREDVFESTVKEYSPTIATCNVSKENVKTALQSEEKESEPTISNMRNINPAKNYMKEYFFREMGEDELDTEIKYDASKMDYRPKKDVLRNRVKENNSTIDTCNVSEENVETGLQSEEKKSEPTISQIKNINPSKTYMKEYFFKMMGKNELDRLYKCGVSERDFTAKKDVLKNSEKENNSAGYSKNNKGSSETTLACEEKVFLVNTQQRYNSDLGLNSTQVSKIELFDEIPVSENKDTQNRKSSEILTEHLDQTGESSDETKDNSKTYELDKKLPLTNKELILNCTNSGKYSESGENEFQEPQEKMLLNTNITTTLSKIGSTVTDNPIPRSGINDHYENNNEDLLNNNENKVIGQDDDSKINICELVEDISSSLLCSSSAAYINDINSNNSEFLKLSQVKELTDYYNYYSKIHDENQNVSNKSVDQTEDSNIIPYEYVKININKFENLYTDQVTENVSKDFDFTATDANCKSIESVIITGSQETIDKKELDSHKRDLPEEEDFLVKYEENGNCFPDEIPLDTVNTPHCSVNPYLVEAALEEQTCFTMLSDRISEDRDCSKDDITSLSKEERYVQDPVNKEHENGNCFPDEIPIDTENTSHCFVNPSLVEAAPEDQNYFTMLSNRISEDRDCSKDDITSLSKEESYVQDPVNKEQAIECMPNSDKRLEQEYEDEDFKTDITKSGHKAIQDDRSEIEWIHNEKLPKLEQMKDNTIFLNGNNFTAAENFSVSHDFQPQKEQCWLDKVHQEEIPKLLFFTTPGCNEKVYEKDHNISDDNENPNKTEETDRLKINEEYFQSKCVVNELVSKVSIASKNISQKPDPECEKKSTNSSTVFEHVIVDKNIYLNDKTSTIPTNITDQHNIHCQVQRCLDNDFQEKIPSLFSTEYASVPEDSNKEEGFINSENKESKFIQETSQAFGIECNEKCFESDYDVNKPLATNNSIVPKSISYVPESEDEKEKEQLETLCKEELELKLENVNISLKKIHSCEVNKDIMSEHLESTQNQNYTAENVCSLKSVESEFTNEEQLNSEQLPSCHSLDERKIQFEEACKTKNYKSDNSSVLHSPALNEPVFECPENNFDYINTKPKCQLEKNVPYPTNNSSHQEETYEKDEFLKLLDGDIHTWQIFGSEDEYMRIQSKCQIEKDMPYADNNFHHQEETCEIEEKDEFLKLLDGDIRTQQMFGSEYAALMKEMYDTKEPKIENEFHANNNDWKHIFLGSEHKKNDHVDTLKPQTIVDKLDNQVLERKCETKVKESVWMKHDSAREEDLNSCREGLLKDSLHSLEVQPTNQTKEINKVVLAHEEKISPITKQYVYTEDKGTEILHRELSSSENEEENHAICGKIYKDKEIYVNREPSSENAQEICITDNNKDEHKDVSEVIIGALSNEATLNHRSVSGNIELIREQIQTLQSSDTQDLSNDCNDQKIVETHSSLSEVNEIPVDKDYSTKNSSFDSSLLKETLKIKKSLYFQEESLEATNKKSCNEPPINQSSVRKNEERVTETVNSKLLGETSSANKKSSTGYKEPMFTYKASQLYINELIKSKWLHDKEVLSNDSDNRPSSSHEINELSVNDCSKTLTKNLELLDEKSSVTQQSPTGYVEPMFTYKASQLYINDIIKSRQPHDNKGLTTDLVHSETEKFCKGSQNVTCSGKLTAEESLLSPTESNSFTNMTNQDKMNLNTINEQCRDSNCIDCLALQQLQINESVPGYRESIAEVSNTYLKTIFDFKIQYQKTDYKPPTEPKSKRMSRRQLRKSIINSLSVHIQIDFSDIQHLIHQYEDSQVHGIPKKEEENMFYKQKKIKSQIGKRYLYSQTSVNNLSKFQHSRSSYSKANLLKSPSRMSTTQALRPTSKANLLRTSSRTTQVLRPSSNTNLLRMSTKKISQHASSSKLDLSSKDAKQLKRSPSICRQPRRNVRQCKISSKHALSTNKDKYPNPINSIPYTQSSISCNLSDTMNSKIAGNPYPELKFQFVPVIAEIVNPYDGELIPSDTDSEDKFPVKPARRIIKKYSSSKKCLVYEEENLRPEMLPPPKRTNSVVLGISVSKCNLSRQSSMLSVLPRTGSSYKSVADNTERNKSMLSRVPSDNKISSITIIKDLPRKGNKSALLPQTSSKHQLSSDCLSLPRQSSRSSLPHKTRSRHQLPPDSQGLPRQSSRSSLPQKTSSSHQLPSDSPGLPRQSSRSSLPQKFTSRHQLLSDNQGLPRQSSRSSLLQKSSSRHQLPSDCLGLPRQSSKSSLHQKSTSRHQLLSENQELPRQSSKSSLLQKSSSRHQLPSDNQRLPRQSSRSSLLQKSSSRHQLQSDNQELPRQSSRSSLSQKSSSRHQLQSDNQELPRQSSRSSLSQKSSSRHQLPSDNQRLPRQSSRSSLLQSSSSRHQLESDNQRLPRQSSRSSLLQKSSSRHQLQSDNQELPRRSSRSSLLQKSSSRHQLPSDNQRLPRQSSRSSLLQSSSSRHQLESDNQRLPRQRSRSSLLQKSSSRHQLQSDNQELPRQSSRSSLLQKSSSRHQLQSDNQELPRRSSRSSLLQKSSSRHQLRSDNQGLPRQSSRLSLLQKSSSRHQLPSD